MAIEPQAGPAPRFYLNFEPVSVDGTRFTENTIAVLKDNTLYYCDSSYTEILPNDFLPATNSVEDLDFLQKVVKGTFKLNGIVGFMVNSFGKYQRTQTFLEAYGLMVVDLDHKPLPKILGYGTASNNIYQRYGTDPAVLVEKFNLKHIYYSTREESALLPYFECRCLPFFKKYGHLIENLTHQFRLVAKMQDIKKECFLLKCKGNYCVSCTMYIFCAKLFSPYSSCFVNNQSFAQQISNTLARYACSPGYHDHGNFKITVCNKITPKKTIKTKRYNPIHEARYFKKY